MKTKLVGLLTLAMIIGFVGFLWSIKNNADNTAESQPVANKTKTTAIEESTLPEPPKEKWGYMEELKNKEVEVGEYEVVDKGPWKMQCGSFKTQKQAETLKANIAFAGLEAKIIPPTGKNNTYYRVIMGPYEKKRQAEKDRHKLKNNNINYCQIWLWT